MVMATHTHSGPPSDLINHRPGSIFIKPAGAVLEANSESEADCVSQEGVLKTRNIP